MVQTKKFSQFNGPSPIQSGDIVVGLRAGDNWQFTGVGGGGGGGNGQSLLLIINQDNHGFTGGEWVRINASGLYVRAISTSAQNAEIAGTVYSVQNVNQFTLCVVGYIPAGTAGFTGLQAGGVYFLSDTNLGQMTLNPPTINGEVSLPLGIAESATTFWVRQSRGVVIASPPPVNSGGGGGGGVPVTHEVFQTGHGFAVGNWLRMTNVDTIYALADGTSLANAQVIGVVKSVPDADHFILQQSGWINAVVTLDDLGAPIVSGDVYYISTTVPGFLTNIEPSSVGQATRPCYIAESTSNESGWVFPQRPLTVTTSDTPTNIIPVNQNSHGFTAGQYVRVGTNNFYTLAMADNAIDTIGVGFVIQVIDVNNFVLQTSGFCSAFTPPVVSPVNTFTPAAEYFLSDTIPGGIQIGPPASLASYSKPVFIALNSTMGYIEEQRPLLNAAINSPPDIVIINQPGHGFTAGQYIRINSANTYVLALADSAIHTIGVGFVIEKIDDDNFILQTSGFCSSFVPPVVAPVNTFTPAAEYFLSDTVPGGIQIGAPAPLTSYSKPVFVALNAIQGYIEEQRPLLNSVLHPNGGGGGIIQVVQTAVTTCPSFPINGGWSHISALDCAITTQSSLSRVKITAWITWSYTAGLSGPNDRPKWRLYRDGAVIPGAINSAFADGGTWTASGVGGPGNGFTVLNTNITYVDSPSISGTVIYSFYFEGNPPAFNSLTLNKTTSSGTLVGTAISTVICEEIA